MVKNSAEKCPQKKAKNMKNFYVQKINSMSQLVCEHQKGPNKQSFCDKASRQKFKKSLSTAQNLSGLEKKRENNRDSARRARERKKVYMKLLENIVDKLDQQLHEAEELIQESGICLEKLKEKGIKMQEEDDIGNFLIPEMRADNTTYHLNNSQLQVFASKKNMMSISNEIIDNICPAFRPSQDFLHKKFLDQFSSQKQKINIITEKYISLKDSEMQSQGIQIVQPEYEQIKEKLKAEYIASYRQKAPFNDNINLKEVSGLFNRIAVHFSYKIEQ